MKSTSLRSPLAYSSSKKSGKTLEFLLEKTASPSRNRMANIGQKLSNLQATVEKEKNLKPESFEAGVRHLDDKITRDYQYSEEKYKLVVEQISKVQESIATEVLAREILDERKEKELKLAENNVYLALNIEKQETKEATHIALKQVEEQVQAARMDLITEERERMEEIERQHKIIAEQVELFERDLREETNMRTEDNEFIIKRIGDKIQKFQESMEIDKKVREETENVLFKLLEDMDYKFQNEITREKKVRERSEEEMLKLLEETCARIEIQLSP